MARMRWEVVMLRTLDPVGWMMVALVVLAGIAALLAR
jgi:hypothetical protein